MPKGVAELKALEIENNVFNRSFVKVAKESATKANTTEVARTRVPEATLASTYMQMIEHMLLGKPPATNTNWKMEEASK